MSSKKQVPVKKQKNDETPKKTQKSPSNQEKNDLANQIKSLQSEIKSLTIENTAFKNKFDLKTIINELYQKGITELDPTEMAKDMIKMELEEADKRHSEEKKDMEKKYKKEIEKLKQKLQGEDQLPNHTIGDSMHSQETDEEIAKYRTRQKELESEIVSLNAGKGELNNNIQQLNTEKESLTNQLEKTKESLSKKDNEITELKKQVADLTTRKKSTLQADTENVDKEIKRLQKDIKALNQSEENNKSLNENLEKEEEAKDKISQQMQALQKEKNELKKRLEKEEETKDNISQQMQALQKEHNELTKRENSNLLAEKQNMDAEKKRLQDEIKTLKQSEEKNKSLNEKLKKEEEAKNQQIRALEKENNELKHRLKESQSPPLSKVVSANDNKIVQQLKAENERLLSRLSELAGAQMTHNNPNIADLSDVFRPTKLSEEYSQLYDNLWTDAFEEHNSKKEEDVIQMLRKGLLGSYKFCENVCKEFTVQLTNSSLALPNSKPHTRLQDIPIVYQKQLQDMRKSFGVFLMNDVKESYREKQNYIEGGDKTKNYIDACVELCWLMVIQDPPVVIETPASKESTFDTNTYRAYTTTGPKVDFVVWPALRLHHGGPLLAKGVAQGKN